MPNRTYKDFEERVREELNKRQQTPTQSGTGVVEQLKAIKKRRGQ